MKLLKFEMKKLWKQKKFLWIFFIVFISTVGIFQQNIIENKNKAERALANIEPYQSEINRIQREFQELSEQQELGEVQLIQLEFTKDMGRSLLYWRVAIERGEYDKIPAIEGEFLEYLIQYEESGGEFPALSGIEKEIVVQKNAWLQKYGLSYEDEEYPVSPHLFIVESTGVIANILGLLILIFFFGNIFTVEKEQRTWLTLKTQPVPKWKLLVSKYNSLVVTMLIFLLMIASLGLAVPFIFTDYGLHLQYPIVLLSGDTFTIIPTSYYLARAMILFISASLFIFSIVIFVGSRMKNTFSALLVILFIFILGFIITVTNEVLYVMFNPFLLLNITELVKEIPKSTDWLYPLFASVWSLFFLMLTIFLPHKDENLSQSSNIKKPFNRGGTTEYYNNDLRNITLFEWRKLLRKGLVQQVFALLLLTSTLGYFIISQQTNEKEATYLAELEERVNLTNDRISFSQETIETYKRLGKESGHEEIYESMIEGVEKTINFELERLTYTEAAIQGYKNGNWIPFYEYQLYENLTANKEIDTGENFIDDRKSVYGTYTIEASISQKHWLMERNIQPILSGEFISTIHHNWGNHLEEKKAWEKANELVDDSGLFSLHIIITKYVYFLPVILFLFLLGGGLAAERGKKATIRFLLTQPLMESKLFLGKTIHAMVVAMLSSLGIYTLMLLIGTIFNRFGDWNYPILHYDTWSLANSSEYSGNISVGYGFHFIPLGEYVIKSIILLLMITLFCLVITNFIAVYLKSTLSVFTTSALIITVGYVVSNQYITDKVHLSPFIYLNIPKVINGEMATLVDNAKINVMTGSLILLLSSLILIFIGYNTLKWKNKYKSSVVKGKTSELAK